jgi:hypothetical protein
MTVLARTKKPKLQAGYLLADVARFDEREHGHWLRTAILAAGLALVGAGLVLGLAVVWNQLARALPLAALLHRLRALRATILTVAGLGLVLFGRSGSRLPRRSGNLPRAGRLRTLLHRLTGLDLTPVPSQK